VTLPGESMRESWGGQAPRKTENENGTTSSGKEGRAETGGVLRQRRSREREQDLFGDRGSVLRNGEKKKKGPKQSH